MYSYSLAEWLLFFYIYCFLGWVWESGYVSLRQKKWVNRGFLHGPFLPIYGSGAIMVLLVTIPVKENLGLVFVCGMIGATFLEYVTGALMEALFHVRYWDYSHEPFNLNGHICLKASLAWGAFSILMIRILHQPIELLVMTLNQLEMEIVAFILTAGIGIDTIKSFNEAMNLKEMLMNLSQSNTEIQLIRKRLDVVIAVIDTDASKLKEKLLQSKQNIEERLVEEKRKYQEAFKQMDFSREKVSYSRALVEQSIDKVKQRKDLVLRALSEKASTYLKEINEYTKEKEITPPKEIGNLKVELEELAEKIKKQKEAMSLLKNKTYARSIKILRRNPNTVSKKHEAALKEIKEIEEIQEEDI